MHSTFFTFRNFLGKKIDMSAVNVRRRNKARMSDEEVELMGAQSYEDYWNTKGANETLYQTFLTLTGKHTRPNAFEIMWNMFLELIGCMFLGAAVTLVRALSASGNSILNGFMVGLTYAAVYYGIHQLPCHVPLRRHLNWGVSLAYVWVGELGMFGWLMYAVTQTLGGIFGGFLVSGIPALLPGAAIGAAAPLAGATVPLPHTGISSFGYAFGLEFFLGFFVIFALLAGEFWGTRTDNDRILGNNYENGVRIASILLVGFITAFYSMQIYTLSNVTYLSGLMAGLMQGGIRDISNAASLSSTVVTNTVFPSGSAWAFYLFMSGLSGFAAGGVYMLFVALRYKGSFLDYTMPEEQVWIPRPGRKPTSQESTSVESQYLQHVSASATQERALSSPYHKMK